MKKLSTIAITLLIASSPLLNAAFREDVTLHVPSEYATIYDALYDLDEKTISKDVFVTIQVADGTYNMGHPVIVEHPYSHRIKIIGNITSASACILNFSNGTNGFEINTSIAEINGFKIQGVYGQGKGVFLENGSRANFGTSLEITSFEMGIHANSNSSVYCNEVEVSQCSKYGIYASNSSYVSALSSVMDNTRYGFCSNTGSAISTVGSTSKNNSSFGFYSIHGAYIEAQNATVSGNAVDYRPAIGVLGPYGGFIGQ